MPPSVTMTEGVEPAAVRAERVVARAEAAVDSARALSGRVDHAVAFAFFVAYLLLAVINFWLGVLAAIVGTAHAALRGVMLVVLFASGGVAPAPGPRPASVIEHARRNGRRVRGKATIWLLQRRREAARLASSVRSGSRTFWFLSFERKLVSAFVVALGVGIPAVFLVPRPHDVRVTDDNAMHYTEGGGRVVYLIHAVDLAHPGQTREYVNEDAWWLGKVNSQGLKSRIQLGRQYRFWVVGLRWYYLPRLFPNVISAVEIHPDGRPVTEVVSPVPSTSGAAGPSRPGESATR